MPGRAADGHSGWRRARGRRCERYAESPAIVATAGNVAEASPGLVPLLPPGRDGSPRQPGYLQCADEAGPVMSAVVRNDVGHRLAWEDGHPRGTAEGAMTDE